MRGGLPSPSGAEFTGAPGASLSTLGSVPSGLRAAWARVTGTDAHGDVCPPTPREWLFHTQRPGPAGSPTVPCRAAPLQLAQSPRVRGSVPRDGPPNQGPPAPLTGRLQIRGSHQPSVGSPFCWSNSTLYSQSKVFYPKTLHSHCEFVSDVKGRTQEQPGETHEQDKGWGGWEPGTAACSRPGPHPGPPP